MEGLVVFIAMRWNLVGMLASHGDGVKCLEAFWGNINYSLFHRIYSEVQSSSEQGPYSRTSMEEFTHVEKVVAEQLERCLRPRTLTVRSST